MACDFIFGVCAFASIKLSARITAPVAAATSIADVTVAAVANAARTTSCDAEYDKAQPADTPRMKRREQHTYRDMYVTDDKKIKAISSISGKAAIHKARKKDMRESNLTE